MILRIFNWIMATVMLAPLVLIIWMSFTPAAFFRLPVWAFSLRWYGEAFNYPGFLNSFILSLQLALVSGTIADGAFSSLAPMASCDIAFAARRGWRRCSWRRFWRPASCFGIAMLQFVNGLGLYNTFWCSVRPMSADHALRAAQRPVDSCATCRRTWNGLRGCSAPRNFACCGG